MNIMFCDIEGTFTGPSQTRKEDLSKFKDLLEKLGKFNDENKIMICFNSTTNLTDILKYIKEFLPYIKNSTIVLGPQFSEKSEWNNGKVKDNSKPKLDKMINVISSKDIKNLFCADDSETIQNINRILLAKRFPNLKIKLFTPKKEGLDEKANEIKGIRSLNNQIENFLQNEYEREASIL